MIPMEEEFLPLLRLPDSPTWITPDTSVNTACFSDEECSMFSHWTCNSYNMATRALADLSPEGAKCPRAINQSSA